MLKYSQEHKTFCFRPHSGGAENKEETAYAAPES